MDEFIKMIAVLRTAATSPGLVLSDRTRRLLDDLDESASNDYADGYLDKPSEIIPKSASMLFRLRFQRKTEVPVFPHVRDGSGIRDMCSDDDSWRSMDVTGVTSTGDSILARVFNPVYNDIRNIERPVGLLKDYRIEFTAKYGSSHVITFETWSGNLVDSMVRIFFTDVEAFYHHVSHLPHEVKCGLEEFKRVYPDTLKFTKFVFEVTR